MYEWCTFDRAGGREVEFDGLASGATGGVVGDGTPLGGGDVHWLYRIDLVVETGGWW